MYDIPPGISDSAAKNSAVADIVVQRISVTVAAGLEWGFSMLDS
jgi:hypothetical protein